MSERNMLKSEGLRRRVTPIAAALLLAALLVVLTVLWRARPAEAAFPRANGKIAYEADDFWEGSRINAIDPTTGDEITLSESEDYSDWGPAWSADGQQIAFTRNSEIYVMDPDPSTKDITRITKNNTGGESPDWSPSGKKIVFEGKYGILVMNKDGSGRKALTRGGYEPVWSPDGRKIAFVRWVWAPEWGYEGHLHVMNKDGSRDKTLTFGDNYSPTWQPIVR